MKFENFEKAKSLVEEITKHNEKIKELSGEMLSVKVMDNQWTIMTIGAWSSCEHSCQDIADSFIKLVKDYYQRNLEKLHDELSVL